MKDKHPLTDTLVEEEPAEEPSAGRWAWLICIGSPEDKLATAGRVIPLEGAREVVFGRDESSEGLTITEDDHRVRVGIPFGWVSGRHAELRVTEVGPGLSFSLRDLGSRNGTLVNGERLHDEVRLRPADVFEVGRSFWTVREVGLRKLRGHKLSELDPTGTCSPHLHHIHRTLHRLARSSIPIVLRGETGTGKEYLARAIHNVSGRSGPLVVANLGALSDDRVEAVLFGGAGSPGLFEEANGGTLMLDELGELSPAVQGKLLSALAEGRAARVGEQAARSFDVRIICATLHDLSRMVEAGRFRPDLYSRLAGFVAELPPLRARREDLGLLTRAVIRDLQREGRPVRITSNAFRRMLMRAWPFNIRQLRQTLATASLLASGDGTITADALAEILDQDDGLPENPDDVRRLRADLVRLLAEHAGDTDAVARAMDRDAYQVHRWLQRFDLRAESFKTEK
jgi:transcriptional regulator with PAS, ATPase and Fis domain